MFVMLDNGLFASANKKLRENEHVFHVDDVDTRRTIVVTLPEHSAFDPPQGNLDKSANVRAIIYKDNLKKATDALAMHRDSLPSNTVAIKVDEAAKLLSFSTAWDDDVRNSTDYIALEEYQLPADVATKTVLRSELTEVGRIAKIVDLVSYPSSLSPPPSSGGNNRLVFKYSTISALNVWTEVQILARVPQHPNLVPVDRLVLDEVTGSKVIGFTMRYVAGETLDKANRLLKLKWLKELLQVVDDLNLKYGIMHNDIADRNLMIDRDTDSMLLIDFNAACPIKEMRDEYLSYQTGGLRQREDVRSVLLFVYSFITRDPSAAKQCFGGHPRDRVEDKYFLEPEKWVRHPDVELDHDVAEFYYELAAWFRRRRAGDNHHTTEGPEHIRWPVFPDCPSTMEFSLQAWRETGNPYLDWSRPPKAKLDPTRRLLATGRYADEELAAQKAMAARKTGPKRPMVHPGQLTPEELEKLFRLAGPPPTGPSAADHESHGPSGENRAGKLQASGTTRKVKRAQGRRKLAPRQAKSPAKRKRGTGGAGAGKRVAFAVAGPAKRRRSLRISSAALSRRRN